MFKDGIEPSSKAQFPGVAARAGARAGLDTDAREAWDRVRRRLRAEVGEEVYSSWFPRIELDGIHDGFVRLSVPTRFLKTWIQQHYIERLVALWQEEGSADRVELIVRTAVMRAPGATPMPVRAAVTRPAAPIEADVATPVSIAMANPAEVANG